MRHLNLIVLILLVASQAAWADGPRDNIPEDVRRVPPAGIELSAEDRAALEEQLELLRFTNHKKTRLMKNNFNMEFCSKSFVYLYRFYSLF